MVQSRPVGFSTVLADRIFEAHKSETTAYRRLGMELNERFEVATKLGVRRTSTVGCYSLVF
jgi:hypothetical protein